MELGGESAAAVNVVARWVSDKCWTGTATALSQHRELAVNPIALFIEYNGLTRANLRGHAEASRGHIAAKTRHHMAKLKIYPVTTAC